ncbi:MAG: hypothetical protein JST22_14745 [Bacteroidetes bacterium]|nr:hypothetical protein [Bacteroidota bacterium]
MHNTSADYRFAILRRARSLAGMSRGMAPPPNGNDWTRGSAAGYTWRHRGVPLVTL